MAEANPYANFSNAELALYAGVPEARAEIVRRSLVDAAAHWFRVLEDAPHPEDVADDLGDYAKWYEGRLNGAPESTGGPSA